ncbi:MAG: universal stress protein [Acidimicrobiales bacterium]
MPDQPTPTPTQPAPPTRNAQVDEDTVDVVQAAGRFRIYLGAAAGVGKTFAMLNEAKRRVERGTDIVIGFVETHNRAHTIEMCEGLEVVPRKQVEYRGTVFEEMDLDAVLTRKPAVALIDELAHTNVPGSGRHEKRWEDVLELIENGISVITTVNIQHLESLADAVERISGTHVRERVPDWVVRTADQIELVDSSPEQLRRRMLHGNIYPTEKIPQALGNFFRTENLTALRELALRFLADETDDDLLEYLRRHDVTDIWETTERILVCVTAAPGTDMLLRRSARLASRLKSDLHVIHVSGDAPLNDSSRHAISLLHKLADDLGALWEDLKADDAAQAIVDYAKKHQITQIVLGSSRRSRWQEMTKGEIVRRILRYASDAGIDVHVIARRDAPGVNPGDDTNEGG